ncbi:hypothetical protein DPEC_G00043090 [Dallia pectoralis]|uniref:Uncharacterized protein n=1 Tax=Dallia pectoralis TaxID=75939 RepID=A0ACC2H9P2_DALPE|nr:hypothetical protein DPEC_G00043090 [Dallia pectoralis]
MMAGVRRVAEVRSPPLPELVETPATGKATGANPTAAAANPGTPLKPTDLFCSRTDDWTVEQCWTCRTLSSYGPSLSFLIHPHRGLATESACRPRLREPLTMDKPGLRGCEVKHPKCIPKEMWLVHDGGESTAQKGHGTCHSRMTGQFRRVAPLQHCRSRPLGNKQPTRRAITWARVPPKGCPNLPFDPPLEGSHNPSQWQDGLWRLPRLLLEKTLDKASGFPFWDPGL